MAKSIGIDLGTTNSVAAIKRVHTEVLKNAENEYITPSCATVRKSAIPLETPEWIVGKNALEWMKQDPENTVTAVKRLMGRNFGDREVGDILEDRRLHYQIQRHSKGTENSLAILVGGNEYTPEEISSQILEKMRKDAETALEDDVEYAVITVPAYFNDKQKHATRTAAALAGIKVRRLLPEPTAAAISFGVDTIKGDDAMTVLVFDFGGGTFDLSVLTISGGQFIEQGKGGDMWLGGEDIDRMIADYALKEIAKEHDIDNIAEFLDSREDDIKKRFVGELRAKVEQAKIRLSSDPEAYIEILGILKDDDGDILDVDVELSREDFDKLIAPIIESMVRITKKMLGEIHYTPDLVDQVLLVGGSSQIPGVADALKKEFGEEKVRLHERPMLAIAEGAAILSHRLSDAYECPKCGLDVAQQAKTCEKCGFDLEKFIIEQGVFDIVHSAAHDYYIRLENDEKQLMIEKNTPLPCEKTDMFSLVHPEQKLVHMKFFNIVNDEDESIGDLWLGMNIKDEGESEKVPSVSITLKIDESNIVEVSASINERPDINVSKTLSRGKADEKLFVNLESVIVEANEKGYNTYSMTDLTHRSLSIIKDIHKVVDATTYTVDEKIYNRAKNKIDKAKRMAAEEQNSLPTIFYAKAALENFGPAISPDTKKKITDAVKDLRKMDEDGSYEENVKALEYLNDVLNDELGIVNILMEIQKAGEYCMDHDPSKAPKFYQAIRDVLEALNRGDDKTAMGIMETIAPEAYALVRNTETEKAFIFKDIAKQA